MFFGSPTMVASMQLELASTGLSVSECVQRGSLVLSSERDHLKNGSFNTEDMLQGLRDAVDQSLKDGYVGLFATGDMTWEFGGEKNLPKLMEYECGLEQMFRKLPHLSGICQYHIDTLPLDIIGQSLYVHKSVYINHSLQRISPYYMQPEALVSFKQRPIPKSEIEHLLRESAAKN